MARCGCQSAQCSCVLTAGSGVTVTGGGNADDPYVISANAGALTVADTDTVDLNLTGTGTGSDPYQLTGNVNVAPAPNLLTAGPDGLAVACEDVQDCVGQAIAAGQGVAYDDAGNAISALLSADAGNVVAFGSDGGLFAVGAGQPVAVGCGLTGDGSAGAPLTVAAAQWGFPCDAAANGESLACGDDGLLYGAPVQTVWNPGFSGGALTFTPPAGTSADNYERFFTLTLTNPDPCRVMRGLALLSATHRVTLDANADIAVLISGDAHHRWSNGTTGPRQMFHRMQAWLVLNIPPGGTQALNWSVGSNLGSGTGTVIQTACSVRVFGVSM
jgi:hypothetical protein